MSTNSNHTPGPWTHDETWGLIMAGETEIAACHSGIKANARLIACAPEMLDALRESLKSLEYAAQVLQVPSRSTFRENIALVESLIARVQGDKP